jgi:hypothetical protein
MIEQLCCSTFTFDLSGRGGYMEIILVYSLLPLFFVLLLVFVALSFLKETALSKAGQFQHDSDPQESKIA